MLCCTTMYFDRFHYAMLYCTTMYFAVLYYAMLYCTTMYFAALCYAQYSYPILCTMICFFEPVCLAIRLPQRSKPYILPSQRSPAETSADAEAEAEAGV